MRPSSPVYCSTSPLPAAAAAVIVSLILRPSPTSIKLSPDWLQTAIRGDPLSRLFFSSFPSTSGPRETNVFLATANRLHRSNSLPSLATSFISPHRSHIIRPGPVPNRRAISLWATTTINRPACSPSLSLAEPTVFLPISCCLRFYFPPSAPMSVCPAAVWSRTVGGTRYVYIQPPQLVLHPRRREIDTVECRSKRKRKNQSKIPFDIKTTDGSRRAKVKTEVLLCRSVHTERRIDPRHWIATCQTKGFLTTPPCVCQSVSVSIK